MSESSLFLLHATCPQSLGKPAAQVGEKLSLWTLKEEREKKKIYLAFELSQQQHTQEPYLSRVCMGIQIKSQITWECSTRSGRTAVFLYSSFEMYSWVYFLRFHYFSRKLPQLCFCFCVSYTSDNMMSILNLTLGYIYTALQSFTHITCCICFMCVSSTVVEYRLIVGI